MKIRFGRLIAAGASCSTLLLLLAGCVRLPEPRAANPANDGGHLADSAVAAKVQTALNQSANLQGLHIAVTLLKGDARLSGVVDSQTQINEAIRLARSARGEHAIHDELTLRSSPAERLVRARSDAGCDLPDLDRRDPYFHSRES